MLLEVSVTILDKPISRRILFTQTEVFVSILNISVGVIARGVDNGCSPTVADPCTDVVLVDSGVL